MIGWITACSLLTLRAAAATFTVDNTNDSGAGSLRQALADANANAGLDTIVFQIPGSGVHTISPGSALPPVSEPVIIDGTTQPGYSNKPLIELDGTNAGNNSGLRLLAGNSTVRGLAINRFRVGGIQLENAGTNIIQANFIGTDATGTLRRGNSADGVLVTGSSWNLIGGTNSADRNVLSANGDGGVYILNGSHNVLWGNYIGTTADGTTALGNTNSGVIINSTLGNQAILNEVGGTLPGAGNVISGNAVSGVMLNGITTRSNLVQGNLIGTDTTGTAALANSLDGVTASDSPGNGIGGLAPGAANLISGNRQNGVALHGAGATNNLVQGNRIGLRMAGNVALANGYSGIALTGANLNQIGGTVAAARNVISGNTMAGIFIEAGSSNNVVQGNYIGTDVTGSSGVGNVASGISINGSGFNRVGGAVAEARNLISGNNGYGIDVFNAGASSNVIQGNFIGTDAAGGTAVRNQSGGVHLATGSNTLGGGTGAGNLISGNGNVGVFLEGAAYATIQGNFIGTDSTGTRAVGNTGCGLYLSGAGNNLIGGTVSGQGNLISGNTSFGCYLTSAATTANRLQGNLIGPDITGTAGLGNGSDGVYVIEAPANIIGGPQPGAGNQISGNIRGGIFLSSSAGTVIQGNLIGTQRDGVSPLGNASGPTPFHAVECESGANNTTIIGNHIAFAPSIYCGVRVRYGSINNAILDNLIFSNGGLGIDLDAAGVAANDACDTDSGANQLQNFPVLTSAVSDASSITIRGSLNSAPSRQFLIQFFANTACDPRGNGEAEVWLGQTTVTTSAGCEASFTVTLNGPVPAGRFVTATATDPANNTSEFSACQLVTGTGLATVTLGNLAATYDGTPKPVSVVTSPSGLAVTVTYNGSTTPPTDAGTYGVVATVNDANYQGQATGTLVIGKAAQSVNFAPLADVPIGTAPFALSATASSGLPVSFNVVAGPATLNGNLLSVTGAGQVTVRAAQAGNNNYQAAEQLRSFNVTKTLATVALGNLAATYDGTPKPVSVVTTPADLPVTVTYEGSATPPTAAGSYAVVATVNDNSYEGQASGTLVIGKATQSITFEPLADQAYVATPLTLNATASSSLPVSFEVVSGPATVAGSQLTLTGLGLVTVRAVQAGNNNYLAATAVSQSFNVSKGVATVTLGNLNQTYDGTAKAATVATSPADLPVTITYDGADSAPTNAGTYEVEATVTGSTYHGQTNGTLVIAKAAQTITFAPLTDLTLGTGSFALSATADSGLPVAFEIVSGPATLTGEVVSLTGVGLVTVRAAQAGNTNFLAAADVLRSFNVTSGAPTLELGNLNSVYDGTPKCVSVVTSPANLPVQVTYDGSSNVPVNAGTYAVVATVDDGLHHCQTNGILVIAKASQTITFGTLADQYYGAKPLSLSATASSGLPVSLELRSGPATLSTDQLALTGVGLVTVCATQAGNSNYLAAAEVARSFNVKAIPALSVKTAFGGQLSLSWPAANQTELVIKQTEDLATGIWTPVQRTRSWSNGTVTVLVPIEPGSRFYTLSVE